jgi:hypothetical protein
VGGGEQDHRTGLQELVHLGKGKVLEHGGTFPILGSGIA